MKALKKLGFLSALIFAVGLAFGVGNTSNVSALAVKIRDNPDSPQMVQITRRVEGTTTTVRNNFTYSITQDASNPGTITGLPETITMPFWAAPNQYLIAEDSYFLEMDLATFPALGDYKIIIRETGSSDAVNYPVDVAHEYYVYVSVRNKLDTNGQPTGEYVATLAAQALDHDAGDKVDILFLEGAHRSYAKVSKVVSGNLADKERYFKFKVTFDGLTDGDFFDVEGQDATIVYNGETITTSSQLVVGQDNYIYLKHDQVASIGFKGKDRELPVGAIISVEELDVDGYTVYVDDVLGNESGQRTIQDDIDAVSNTIGFRNHKESDVLTGVLLNVAPFVAAGIAVAALALGAFLIRKKNKR